MSRTVLVALVLLSSALVMPGAARAQAEIPAMSRAEVLSALFGDLSSDAGVRVVTADGTIEEGQLLTAGDDGFSVSVAGQAHDVDFRDVRTVEVEGGHALQGTLWGVAGGALAGGFFGVMLGSFGCTTPTGCQSDERAGAWRWGTALAVVGGGIGFWVGRRQVHWHPVFP